MNGLIICPNVIKYHDRVVLLEKTKEATIFEGTPSYSRWKSLGKEELITKILEYTLPIVEHMFGEKLVPRWGHARFYTKGDIVDIHKDGDCDISSSICIGKAIDSKPWYLEIQENKVNLDINEGVFYHSYILHGRPEPLDNEWQAQLMLMYKYE